MMGWNIWRSKGVTACVFVALKKRSGMLQLTRVAGTLSLRRIAHPQPPGCVADSPVVGFSIVSRLFSAEKLMSALQVHHQLCRCKSQIYEQRNSDTTNGSAEIPFTHKEGEGAHERILRLAPNF
eukprot:3406679-Pleurochrysis_carterae.AAC.2